MSGFTGGKNVKSYVEKPPFFPQRPLLGGNWGQLGSFLHNICTRSKTSTSYRIRVSPPILDPDFHSLPASTITAVKSALEI